MPADFLGLDGRAVLITGLANKKSVAWHAGRVLREAGARLLWSVHTAERAAQVREKGLVPPDEPVLTCDLGSQEQIDRLAEEVRARAPVLFGALHSVAFANYSAGIVPFHATRREDFLQALDVSCFSFVALAQALQPLLDPAGALVTVSISTTRMAAQNYGYMAPIKAALDSAVVFLAKSLAPVRVNAVCPGLLKTASSAGIPNYVPAYLFAEQATLRHRAVQTEEVANAIAFLLSPRSSGIAGQGLTLDAGMSANYFDEALVRRATRPGD
jgi:enoyl-[acyl-carrier protein] reductase I